MKIDYEQLYRLTEDFGLSGRRFRVNPSESLQIDEVEAYARGIVRPKLPISFVQQSGKRVCDVICTGFPPLVLVSKAFLDALKRGGLSAWSTYPIKVHDKEAKQVRGYFGLAFLGRAGAVDLSRSKMVWRGPRYEGGPKWQNYVGLFFKDDQWDGSDFFMADGRSTTFVTQKAKDALKKLDIPNVEFERLSEYEERVSQTPPSLRLFE